MKKIIKALSLTLLLPMLFSSMSSCGSDKTDGGDNNKYYVEVSVENFGKFKLELYHDIAPITVDNFVNLVKAGYYDGLTFNRMQEGFVLQGGDGANVASIKGEFAQNGVKNNIHHEKGVISMARSNGNNTASSQFFIMLGEAGFLDGSYAAFGKITEGIEVIDAICDSIPANAFSDYQYCFLKDAFQPKIISMKVIDG